MKIKTIAIMPCPSGSYMVEGPYDHDEDSVSIEPCAFLALVVDENKETYVVPVGFGDQMDAQLTHGSVTLEPSIEDAEKEMNRRISYCKKRNGKTYDAT